MTRWIASDRKGKRLTPGGKKTINTGTRKGRKLLAWLRRRQKKNRRGLRLVKHPRQDRVKLLLDIAAGEIGVTETGANTGTRVKQYQAATTLGGTGWPWCQGWVVWTQKKAGIDPAYEGASVPELEADSRRRGTWKDGNPSPGDLVVFDFDPGDTGVWDADHVGIVERVLPGGVIQTIEGNTSAGKDGSQANGGMVARRMRNVSQVRGYVEIVP